MEKLLVVLLILDYIEGRAQSWVYICILNKTFNIWLKLKIRYMYIVYIKITLHIQVLVYCKKCSYPLDYGPTQNLSNLFFTAKK